MAAYPGQPQEGEVSVDDRGRPVHGVNYSGVIIWAAIEPEGYTHPDHFGDVKSDSDGELVINSQAVTTAKIQNNAVTAEKLAIQAVGEDQIHRHAVTASKIANEAVTLEKLEQIDGPALIGQPIAGSKGLVTTVNMNQLRQMMHLESAHVIVTVDTDGQVVDWDLEQSYFWDLSIKPGVNTMTLNFPTNAREAANAKILVQTPQPVDILTGGQFKVFGGVPISIPMGDSMIDVHFITDHAAFLTPFKDYTK